MNHLISKDAYNQIESMLIVRRNQIVQATSWMFNMVLLGLVLVTFGYFLYNSYNSNQEHQEEEKRIPFEPQVWYSATRNVRSEEYGRQLQPFEIETGYGLS